MAKKNNRYIGKLANNRNEHFDVLITCCSIFYI